MPENIFSNNAFPIWLCKRSLKYKEGIYS